jgi:SAM-dependent methyltransferase
MSACLNCGKIGTNLFSDESIVTKTQLSWLESAYGQSFLCTERRYIEKELRRFIGPRVMQVGNLIEQQQLASLDYPQLVAVRDEQDLLAGTIGFENSDLVVADAAFLPFEPESFSSVILPHVLEDHSLPHQVLREAYRVLRPEGYLLMTGFNPFSLLAAQKHLRPKACYKGQYFSVKRVRDWLQLLGFEVVGSAMYQYAPLSASKRLRRWMNFYNAVGDRWLPLSGGAYMISARKRVGGFTLIGPERISRKHKRRQKLAVTATAGERTADNDLH